MSTTHEDALRRILALSLDAHIGPHALALAMKEIARQALDESAEPPVAMLAWIGKDESHDKVGIRSIGTPMGVLPACMVDNKASQETMPKMAAVMQVIADTVSEPQRLVRFVAVETLQELRPITEHH
ncbi:hypothetical protein [Azohydromonas aeria]|uniref:hypothetical protein n=1 Tax=Azohydromonas aeria TaxID=2590212 RepID=UPI0012FC9270|nr:hypothetical protein [Azohydromonas aeria]